MTSVRQPAVADMFYPGNPDELRAMVREFLDAPVADGDILEENAPKGLIVPHAGYVYSGPIAATAYARLRPWRARYRRVVLLGPAHRAPLRGLALPREEAFASPLGPVPVDQAAVEALRRLPQVQVDSMAHALEHSLEVHLPFLQEALEGPFTIAPLVVGEASPAEVAEALDLLWGGDETLIVVSSDLSHYHDYDTARELDRATSRAIEALQIEALEPDRACGCIPIQGLLQAARQRDLRVVNVDLRNSGDTAGSRGQKAVGGQKVVGYGAYIIV